MKTSYLISVITIILITSCSNNPEPQFLDNVSGYFDLKDSSIVIAYFNNNIGSIYYNSNLDNDNSYKRITFPKEGWDNSPRISNDGKRIVYLSYPKADYDRCNIIIIDLKTKKVDTLITNEPLILEACFSKNDSCIYYISAGVIANYSPIGRKAPHEMDIFEFNLYSRVKRQITNLREYTIQGLLSTYSDSLLAVSIFNPDSMSMGLISITNGKFSRFKFSNDPRYTVSSSYLPISIKQDSLL